MFYGNKTNDPVSVWLRGGYRKPVSRQRCTIVVAHLVVTALRFLTLKRFFVKRYIPNIFYLLIVLLLLLLLSFLITYRGVFLERSCRNFKLLWISSKRNHIHCNRQDLLIDSTDCGRLAGLSQDYIIFGPILFYATTLLFVRFLLQAVSVKESH